MGCFVNFGADWQGPGRILFGNRGAVVVGEIDGSLRDRTREMHRLLQVFEPEAVLTAALNRPATGAPQFVRVPAAEGEPPLSVKSSPPITQARPSTCPTRSSGCCATTSEAKPWWACIWRTNSYCP